MVMTAGAALAGTPQKADPAGITFLTGERGLVSGTSGERPLIFWPARKGRIWTWFHKTIPF